MCSARREIVNKDPGSAREMLTSASSSFGNAPSNPGAPTGDGGTETEGGVNEDDEIAADDDNVPESVCVSKDNEGNEENEEEKEEEEEEDEDEDEDEDEEDEEEEEEENEEEDEEEEEDEDEEEEEEEDEEGEEEEEIDDDKNSDEVEDESVPPLPALAWRGLVAAPAGTCALVARTSRVSSSRSMTWQTPAAPDSSASAPVSVDCSATGRAPSTPSQTKATVLSE